MVVATANVDYSRAGKQRVFVRDRAEVRGELLDDLVRERADNGPDGVVGIGRLQRQIEADEFLASP